MEEGDGTIFINIPKTRICARESVSIKRLKNALKLESAFTLRKPSEVSLKKYSLPGNQPLEVSKLNNELLLLPYRLYSKRQEFERHKARLSIKINEKYKISSTELRNRLNIEGPEDDVRGLIDLDKNFFECVNGRKITSIPLFKSLMPNLNNEFRIRQTVSYRNDCILRIEDNSRRELKTYENSVQKCKDQANYFDNFIQSDYLRSMDFLGKCDDLKVRLTMKAIELQNLANDKCLIMSRLIGLDYKYSVQQKYGRFLYYLSPPTWRLQHRDFARSIEIEEKGFDLGYSSDEDPFVVIFEKLKKEGMENLVTPKLYFERPEEMLQVFEAMEQQQLNYLTHVTYSTPYANSLKKGLTTLRNIMQQSSYSVLNAINEFEALLEGCFKRCNFLEAKFHKICNGMFFDSVGSLEVMKLTLHLEYCYEKLIGEKPFNLSMYSVAKAVESNYMDFSKHFDCLRSDDVKGAISRYLEIERRKMKKAKYAARELKIFERLERDLMRSCLPSTRNGPVPLPPVRSMVRRQLSQGGLVAASEAELVRASLTDGEAEYLTLFTNFTAGEDPADYLQALSIQKPNETNNKP